MTNLIQSFSLHWYIWVIFGLFLGGVLFNKNFRDEADGFLAHMMGMKVKKRRGKE